MSRLVDNWIKGYLVYSNEHEAPEIFHTWVAVSAIGGVLKRNVWFDMSYFNLYPNMYVVLVSPAGLCKKSTAMRMSRPLLAEVPGTVFSVDSTSRERLIQDLAGAFQDGMTAMTAHQSEFASMLTTSKMDMVVFLTDIYDCPIEWSHKTKGTGTNTIKSPFLNLLAGTTPDWIARALPLDTIGIGMTSRIVFVYSHEPRIRPWRPKLSQEQRQLIPMLQADLIHIAATLRGEFKLTREADEWYNKWYTEDRHEERKMADTRTAGYFERKPMHMLKVAMCVSAARKDNLVLDMQDLTDAMVLLEASEENMHHVFAAVGKNPLALDIELVYTSILARDGGIGFAELLDMFKHSVRKEELEEVVDTLRMIGRIELIQDEKQGARYIAKIGK
jgi:hypothetical protein